MSEKKSTLGCICRFENEYCMITLVDVYRIFDNNQHCVLCIGDVAYAIMIVTNGTYYMYDPQSHDVMRFQNGKGATLLLQV